MCNKGAIQFFKLGWWFWALVYHSYAGGALVNHSCSIIIFARKRQPSSLVTRLISCSLFTLAPLGCKRPPEDKITFSPLLDQALGTKFTERAEKFRSGRKIFEVGVKLPESVKFSERAQISIDFWLLYRESVNVVSRYRYKNTKI